MRRFKALLAELLYGLAFLWTLALGLYLIGRVLGAPIQVFRLETEPLYLRDVIVGGGLLLIALYFLVRVIQTERRAKARIRGQGPQGPIWISLDAVREFIESVLQDELNLREARVLLRTSGKGLIVQVHTALPLGESIPRLAERVQTRVKARVEERIGVAVQRVEVLARGIQGEGAPPSELKRQPQTQAEGAEEEPQPAMERDRE
jgi:uncharacterized alkaline shock family protein YloU